MIEAHGGAALWNRLDSLRAEIAFAGFGFRVKFLKHLPFRGTMAVERGGQRVTFEPYPVPGKRGVFEGSEVRIEAADGQVLSCRSQPRAAFQDFRHRLWWDSLDLLYFAGQAGWTYFSVPFVLIDPVYELARLPDPPPRPSPQGRRSVPAAPRPCLDRRGGCRDDPRQPLNAPAQRVQEPKQFGQAAMLTI